MDFKDNSGALSEDKKKMGEKPQKQKRKVVGKQPQGKKNQNGVKKEKEAVRLGKDTSLDMDEFHKKIPAGKNTKDSVFLDLFGQKEYLLQLYRVIHPEDKATTENDLRYITINRVFLRGIYNDLGFMAGDRLMVLVEA